MSRIRRRTFISTVGAAAGSAVIVDPLLAPWAHAATNKIYSAHHEQMVNGTSPSDIQDDWVKAGMDACIRALTGKTELGQAWQAAFAGITPSSKIAVKLNCLKAAVSPQFAVIKALVQGLCSMFNGTFPIGNISVFDNTMSFSGISANRMTAVYGDDIVNLGVVYQDPSPQYASATLSVKGKTFHPATYLHQADYGISLAPLKPHQYYAGGITGVIKNMMGAVSTSTGSYNGGDTFHDGSPYQSFTDLFKNYMINHLQLYIVDMLFAAKTENASGWSKVVKRITMGTDPCAMDAYVADTLNAVGFSGTKAVPQALAAAGLGNASYSLVEPSVSLIPPTGTTTRGDIDAKIRELKNSSASDQEVKQLIRQYREAQ